MSRMVLAFRFSFLLLLGAAPLGVVPSLGQKQSRPETIIWIGQSATFALRWTSGDITAAPAGEPSKVIFSAKEIAHKKFLAFKKENLQDQPPSWRCSYTLKFTILSLVGSLLSYEENEDSYCGQRNGPGWNHPSDQISYRVVDLSQPDRQISLTDFFSESAVLKALLADPTIKEALSGAENPRQPGTVAELAGMIVESGEGIKPAKDTAESPKECGFVFPEHPLRQFAFHHLENGKIAVRLSLDPNSGACHSAHAQLGILLPIPATVEASLTAAQSQVKGFLMDSTRRLSGNRVTVFAFETDAIRQKSKR
jgi:hypothetical protein